MLLTFIKYKTTNIAVAKQSAVMKFVTNKLFVIAITN